MMTDDLALLTAQVDALLGEEGDLLVNASQFAAFIWSVLPRINWAGFYFLRSGKLRLGPFQGKPACNPIELDRGVCGRCVQLGEPLLIEDVRAFEDHIACDPASRSELVVPLMADGACLGVFDIDSPEPGRFGDGERQLVVALVGEFLRLTPFPEALGHYPLP